MLQLHESTIHRIVVACVVLMKAIFQWFNLKLDNYHLASTILEHKLSQLHSEKALVGISPTGMRLLFSKIHPGSLFDFHVTEKNSMWLAGFRKKDIKGLHSKIFLVSKVFLKKAMSEK